jgi:hypothetical protein
MNPAENSSPHPPDDSRQASIRFLVLPTNLKFTTDFQWVANWFFLAFPAISQPSYSRFHTRAAPGSGARKEDD